MNLVRMSSKDSSRDEEHKDKRSHCGTKTRTLGDKVHKVGICFSAKRNSVPNP